MNSVACAVAHRDRAGLIQQQHVDIAGGLDGLAAHGQHVVLHHAVDARDADGREQAADGGRDQADQQGHQHRDGEGHAHFVVTRGRRQDRYG